MKKNNSRRFSLEKFFLSAAFNIIGGAFLGASLGSYIGAVIGGVLGLFAALKNASE